MALTKEDIYAEVWTALAQYFDGKGVVGNDKDQCVILTDPEGGKWRVDITQDKHD